MRLSTTAALSALAAHLPAPVRGHGFLASPRSRQKLAEEAGDESCPHCYNGGSKGNVMANTVGGVWPWPYKDPDESLRHGLCGDPSNVSPQPYMPPGEIDTFYVEGSTITVKTFIKAHHKGHVELRICEIAPWDSPTCGSLDQMCLDQHILLRTADSSAMSGTEHYGPTYWGVYNDTDNEDYGTCSGTPLKDDSITTDWDGWDACWPERYYLGTRQDTPKNSEERGWVAEFQVKLPDGLKCKHCAMQMVYLTSNSCTPPGYRADIQGMTGQSNTETCGSTETLYPEEFWNCADVQVYPSGGSPDPTFNACQQKTYGSGSPTTTTTTTTTTTNAATTTTTTTDPQTTTTATDPPASCEDTCNCPSCTQYEKRNPCCGTANGCEWSLGSCVDPP